MLKALIGRMMMKHGALGSLIKIGDLIVKISKTKKDDEAWEKIKKVIKKLDA